MPLPSLPEYYPTRAQIRTLEERGSNMAGLLGRDVLLVDLGSGGSHKIHTLLAAPRPAVYWPVDISRDHPLASASDLAV
jgi:uncharacterized SAM-dependent methyltransferase